MIYGSPEKIIRVTKNGEKFDCSFLEIKNFSVEDCYKYIYILNNERLKQLANLIPVDMPGFDSGIEAHNKALMQYVGDAAAYVFVIDLEKGTIGQSSLDFLDEIKEYSNSISFVLTKRDKLPPSDVETALKNQIGMLIYSAKQGSGAFNSTVNNIIRPIILQSTQQNIEATFDEYVGSIINYDSENLPDPDSVANKMLGANAALKKIAESGKKFKGAYRVFSTGLTVTTSVIAPWLELIIIFLPDIIGFFGDLIGKSKDEKLKQSIEYEIIPQICNKLRPEIRESLLRVEEERLAEIEDEFQTTLNTEIATLQHLKYEKDKRSTDIAEKKSELSAGIRRIEKIINEIESA